MALSRRAAVDGEVRELAGEVLVTGASGFLGRPLVAALAASGRRVIGLSRRAGGDLRRPESYLPHLRPGMAVFHLAAQRAHDGRRRRDFEAVNATACRDLARGCLERGIGRFVLVTSAHLFGPSAPGTPCREVDGLALAVGEETLPGAAGEPALGWYERSRRAGLLEVRRLAAAGLDTVVLCPTIIFGPDHPAHPNRVTGEIRRFVCGRPPAAVLIGGGTARRDLVYVDDVVGAVLAAERLAPPGAELVLGGEAISHRELLERSLALAGRRPSRLRLSIPAPAALAAARAADRLLRHDPGCGHTAAVVRLLHEWRFDSGRARQLLGYRPLPLAEGLARTVRWLRGRDGTH
ncbi:MAG TPA: NAD-dependent epimerase/dehydratase family protein [Thermoanaerobaculia bacterium]|nr:NAD-dependent epimerase/dehydratase family protein [Thermoanaerobaculia bacterium]